MFIMLLSDRKGETYYYHRKSLSVIVLSGNLKAERKLIQRMLDKIWGHVERQKKRKEVIPQRTKAVIVPGTELLSVSKPCTVRTLGAAGLLF